jgi:O-antigen/teichoic acid export membrane protein
MPRLIVRRSVTAVGIYSSVVLGAAGTFVASQEFNSKERFGAFSLVLFATGLLQSFFDLTVEEALVKYGFRYISHEDWGRLRRLFSQALRFKLLGSAAGALGLLVFAAVAVSSLRVPLLVAAGIPLGYSLEGLAGAALFLRSRYDIRSVFLAWSMLLRLVGVAIGAHYSIAWAIAGILAAQIVSAMSVGVAGWAAFRRFPRVPAEPLGDDRRSIISFVLQSSAATGVISLRGGLAPLLLGGVAGQAQVGLFKIAQSPQAGLQALSAPARMVLLTEQTREWERGRQAAVLAGVRRYTLVAFGLSVVAVPPLYWALPFLIRHLNGPTYVGAASAGRVLLLAAAVQLVVGWTKSFPVTIGKPQLRVWTHGAETIVVLPLVVVLSTYWGATGAALAVLAGMCVFALMWTVIFLRIEPHDVVEPAPLEETVADAEAEAGALLR